MSADPSAPTPLQRRPTPRDKPPAWLREAFDEYRERISLPEEEVAADMLNDVLRQKGCTVLVPPHLVAVTLDDVCCLPVEEAAESSDAAALFWAGETAVVLRAELPNRGAVWIVAKGLWRAKPEDVRAWADKMRSAEWRGLLASLGCSGPFVAYLCGARVRAETRRVAEAEGIGLIDDEGREQLEPRALFEGLSPPAARSA